MPDTAAIATNIGIVSFCDMNPLKHAKNITVNTLKSINNSFSSKNACAIISNMLKHKTNAMPAKIPDKIRPIKENLLVFIFIPPVFIHNQMFNCKNNYSTNFSDLQ